MNSRSIIHGSVRPHTRQARVTGQPGPLNTIEVLLLLRRGVSGGPLPETKTLAWASHRQHLTREAFAAKHGADSADLTKVRDFAASYGLTIVRIFAAGRCVTLRGTVQDMSTAFGVHLALYEGPRGPYLRHTEEVTVPGELAAIVRGVFGLDRRPIARPYFHRSEAFAASSSATTGACLAPPQVADAYLFPEGTDGTGQCIAIIELEGGYQEADLTAYFASLNLPVPTVTAIPVAGGSNMPLGFVGGPDTEVLLDIEVAGAAAPGARMAVYFSVNTEQGFIDAVASAVHDTANQPTVVSISWGEDESYWSAQSSSALNELFQEAGVMGVTVCAASGDHGSADGMSDGGAHVSFPASSPYVLACGGTTMQVVDGKRSSEVVWNQGSHGGASGGGFSSVFAPPDYQQSIASAGRGVPDVAAHADSSSAYVIRVDGVTTVAAGTSAVAPLWAALVARMNQSLGAPVGFLNPALYSLAAAGGLQDITSGGNGAFQAAAGWDACTGLGSPDGTALLAAIQSLTSSSKP